MKYPLLIVVDAARPQTLRTGKLLVWQSANHEL